MIEALLMLKPSELGRLINIVLSEQTGRETDQILTGAEKYLYPLIQAIIIEPKDTSDVIIGPAEGRRQ